MFNIIRCYFLTLRNINVVHLEKTLRNENGTPLEPDAASTVLHILSGKKFLAAVVSGSCIGKFIFTNKVFLPFLYIHFFGRKP